MITTNLTYLPPELYDKPYFVAADMSKFLALIIDSLNHDITIGSVMNPTDKIHTLLENVQAVKISDFYKAYENGRHQRRPFSYFAFVLRKLINAS